MDIRMITHEDVQCWYELSWRPKTRDGPAILLRIHKEIVRDFPRLSPDAPLVKQLMDNFEFKTFGSSTRFGFENCFLVGQKGNFSEFLVHIPVIEKLTDRKCKSCKGSGKDKSVKGDCLFCDGRGRESEVDWHTAYAISATFTLLFSLIEYPERITGEKFPQLLTVHTATIRDLHGGALGGDYSIPLVQWLSSFAPQTPIPEMGEAMRKAYVRMLGSRHLYAGSFWASVDSKGGWLNTSCPGDACGLHPGHDALHDGHGYEFSSHNVDTPMQQITLLAGLAALHDRARKELQERALEEDELQK